jgi:hypothetical protein
MDTLRDQALADSAEAESNARYARWQALAAMLAEVVRTADAKARLESSLRSTR